MFENQHMGMGLAELRDYVQDHQGGPDSGPEPHTVGQTCVAWTTSGVYVTAFGGGGTVFLPPGCWSAVTHVRLATEAEAGLLAMHRAAYRGDVAETAVRLRSS